MHTLADLPQTPAGGLARPVDDMKGVDEARVARMLAVQGAQCVDAEVIGAAEE